MAAPPESLADRTLGVVLAAAFGFPIGVLSGFTGVGGGEYRAPVLLALLGRVRWAIATNLLVGTIVAIFNVVFRQGWRLPAEYLLLGLLLIPGSLLGAYLGAIVTTRVSTRVLKALLAAILIVTGLRLILFELPPSGVISFDPTTVGSALALGFGLGLVSGLLGVAAGEYRIPALILFFGVPTVLAGTLSSLASIPQQLIGHMKHRDLGHTGTASFRLGLTMAAASIVGVALGVVFLGRSAEAFVTQVLGLAMMAAAGRILWDIQHPHPAEAKSFPDRA